MCLASTAWPGHPSAHPVTCVLTTHHWHTCSDVGAATITLIHTPQIHMASWTLDANSGRTCQHVLWCHMFIQLLCGASDAGGAYFRRLGHLLCLNDLTIMLVLMSFNNISRRKTFCLSTYLSISKALLCSPGWSRTCYVDKTILSLNEVHLPMPPKCCE